VNYVDSRNILSKYFFVFIVTLTIYNHGINFMNGRE